MDFDFRLADIFPSEMSIVDLTLIPKDSPGVSKLGSRIVQERTSQILDKLGKASAKAQGLTNIITSGEKVSSSNGDQKVYLLLDFAVNQAIGFIKVGKRKLFLYDRNGNQHEVIPKCILDFYISESRQRSGYGRILFNAMLKTEEQSPEQFAIDRPSDKLILFLKKHYGLGNRMEQSNKFVIFDGFFEQKKLYEYVGRKSINHHLEDEASTSLNFFETPSSRRGSILPKIPYGTVKELLSPDQAKPFDS